MDKDAIADLLEDKNQKLLHFLEQQDPEKWQTGPNGQWTSGQQALQLLQCIKAVNAPLSMPKFLLRLKFGKANSAIRSYDQVVTLYNELLIEKHGDPFKALKQTKVPPLKDKTYILNRLQVESKKLQYKTRKLSDHNMDTLILPHPLLGKMPIREIIMWTTHHIEHHTKTLQEKY